MWIRKEINTSFDWDDFFWSGARDRWNDATDEQRNMVIERLEDLFHDELPTDTQVNDFVWFGCDDIFFPEENDCKE